LAGALQQLRRYGEAAEEFRKAWELAPAEGEHAGRLIRVLAFAKDFDAAEKAAADAVEKLPRSAPVRAAVGALRQARKDLKGSEEELRRAIELAPTAAAHHAELGRLLDDT